MKSKMCDNLIRIGLMIVLTLTSISNGSLVSYWNFDEGTGSTLYDVVGTNNGTLYDGSGNIYDGGSGGLGPNYITGRAGAGTALSFNADYSGGVVPDVDFVEIDGRMDFNVGRGDFTLSGWFNATRSPDSPYLGMLFDDAKHGYSGVDLYMKTDGSTKTGFLTGEIKGPGAADNIYGGPYYAFDDGQWHWIAVRGQGQVLDIFIDGRLTYRGNNVAYGFGTTADTYKNPLLGNTFMGALDDWAFFDEALSAAVGDFNIYGWDITGGDMLTLYQQGPMAVPEPATIMLMGIGTLFFARIARNKRQST